MARGAPTQYFRSYVIPYRKVGQYRGGFDVLVPEKLVVCYDAVSQLRNKITGRKRDEWSKVNWNNPVDNDGYLLDENGRVLNIGARLGGILFAAGGRPCVPGRRVHSGNTLETAGVCGLTKATKLHIENSRNRMIKIHETDWDGVYYGLEITQNVDQEIKLVNIQLAQAAARQSSLDFLEEVYNGAKPEKFQEMKILKWVPLEEVEHEMAAKPSQDFLRNEVELCIQLIFKVLGISQSMQPARDALFNVMYNHQKVDDNVAAAGKLVRMLQGH